MTSCSFPPFLTLIASWRVREPPPRTVRTRSPSAAAVQSKPARESICGSPRQKSWSGRCLLGRVRFVWVGAGEPPREAATHPWVTFTGPMADPSSAMAEFDIMTLPSRDDPFPLVVMEAMLLGKPVVAFDVGGVAHQLGDAGLVVEAGDVSAFARQLRRLVDDETLRTELGELAAARARSLFSWERFEAGVAALLEDVPAGRLSITAARRLPLRSSDACQPSGIDDSRVMRRIAPARPMNRKKHPAVWGKANASKKASPHAPAATDASTACAYWMCSPRPASYPAARRRPARPGGSCGPAGH